MFVVPRQVNVGVVQVVEARPAYLVVEKDGGAVVVADLADPRDGDC